MAKGRLFLIHWDAVEADALAAPLRQDGWEVEVESSDGARAGKAIIASPPDAVVVSLARMPAHGRETVAFLKGTKTTRELPVIFVGGAGDAVDKTKKKIRDAVYVDEAGLKRALAPYAGL